MAELEQGVNRGGNELSGRTKNKKAVAHQPIQNVDFREMNYEQRRAPYDSGSRTLEEKKYDQTREKNSPERKRIDR